MQAARRARTRNCSRSPNLVPYSSSSEPPPSTSRSDPREDPKRGKNSSFKEDGINAFCPLIGQCMAESLGGSIDSREKIDILF